MNAQEGYEYLAQFLSAERKQLFDRLLTARTRHLTVAVEDLYQERNASAVVRTCECFGIQDVHIIENYHPYQISHGIAKGAEEWLDLHIYDQESASPNESNSLRCIRQLRAQGYRIIATTPHAEEAPLQRFDLSEKTALFFGGEKNGLTEGVLKEADGFISIPTVGTTESFNISVAAAIVLYELSTRLRARSDIPWQLSEAEKMQKKLDWAIQSVRRGAELLAHYQKIREANP